MIVIMVTLSKDKNRQSSQNSSTSYTSTSTIYSNLKHFLTLILFNIHVLMVLFCQKHFRYVAEYINCEKAKSTHSSVMA